MIVAKCGYGSHRKWVWGLDHCEGWRHIELPSIGGVVLRHEVYETEAKHLPPDTTYIIYLENIMSAEASGIRGKAKESEWEEGVCSSPQLLWDVFSLLLPQHQSSQTGEGKGWKNVRTRTDLEHGSPTTTLQSAGGGRRSQRADRAPPTHSKGPSPHVSWWWNGRQVSNEKGDWHFKKGLVSFSESDKNVLQSKMSLKEGRRFVRIWLKAVTVKHKQPPPQIFINYSLLNGEVHT